MLCIDSAVADQQMAGWHVRVVLLLLQRLL